MPGEQSTCFVCGRPVYKEGLCYEHFQEEIKSAMEVDLEWQNRRGGN